jgi:hypothetical protein
MTTKKPSYPPYLADDLPPEMLQEIGKIIFLWGRIEYQLRRIITIGFDLSNETAGALIYGMTLQVICGAIRTLTENDHWIKDEWLLENIKKLAIDIQSKSAERNNYAHSLIGFHMENPNEFFRYLQKSPANRINPSAEKITINDLMEISKEARNFLDRAVDLTFRLHSWKCMPFSEILPVQ